MRREPPTSFRESGVCEIAGRVSSPRGVYAITSSARATSMGGNSKPGASAVLLSMTNSILVGSSIGSIAGSSPLKILSANPADRI